MAKQTLSFKIAPVANNWQPRRHFVAGSEPQVLHLPQEMVDSIVDALHEVYIWHACVKSYVRLLRMVSRTFDHGLFSYFATAVSESPFLFRCNNHGIEHIAHLAKSRLAPFVRCIHLADRRISPYVLTLTDMETIDPARKSAEVAAWKEREAWKESRTRLGCRELHMIQKPLRPWADARHQAAGEKAAPGMFVRPVSMCRRTLRQRADFNASFPGRTATWELRDCVSATDVDLRLSERSLQCLAAALGSFINLEQLMTPTSIEVQGVAKDCDGKIVQTVSFCGTFDSNYEYKSKLLRCVCGKAQEHFMSCNDVWPATAELGRLSTMLSDDLPLFSTLTIMSLNFHTGTLGQKFSELAEQDIDNVANFIRHCAGLEQLMLAEISERGRWADKKGGSPTVVEVLLYFAKHNVRFAELENIELDDVGGKDEQALVLSWLISNIEKLTSLKIRAELDLNWSAELTLDIQAWTSFVAAVYKIPTLTTTSIDYRPFNRNGGEYEGQLQFDHDGPPPSEQAQEKFIRRMARHVKRWGWGHGALHVVSGKK